MEEIKSLKKQVEELSKIKSTEESIRSSISQYLDLETEMISTEDKKRLDFPIEVLKQKKNLRVIIENIGKTLNLSTKVANKSNRQWELEKECLQLRASVKNQDLEIEQKCTCNICQEKVRQKFILKSHTAFVNI